MMAIATGVAIYGCYGPVLEKATNSKYKLLMMQNLPRSTCALTGGARKGEMIIIDDIAITYDGDCHRRGHLWVLRTGYGKSYYLRFVEH